jgi:hypothetical protein
MLILHVPVLRISRLKIPRPLLRQERRQRLHATILRSIPDQVPVGHRITKALAQVALRQADQVRLLRRIIPRRADQVRHRREITQRRAGQAHHRREATQRRVGQAHHRRGVTAHRADQVHRQVARRADLQAVAAEFHVQVAEDAEDNMFNFNFFCNEDKNNNKMVYAFVVGFRYIFTGSPDNRRVATVRNS